ncbi:Subtilisin like protease [Trichoderma cornu-damae]|uniref:Subtilisin like protease n=1 Tax=Trichoderma cornu-damae TaxID=654480 RepID=A0A9P8QKZ2_9HYPO|nr:Subtilisin like protease [Trichoderma cornu-damae]
MRRYGLGDSPLIPGAYIIEYEDDHEEAALFDHLRQNGLPATKRLDLNYTLFKGASFQLNAIDLDPDSTSAKIASAPAVKRVWPVQRYQRPANTTLGSASSDSSRLSDASDLVRRETSTQDGYGPHVQVQIDKLHAEGITGKGVRIGIIDSGVDFNHPALGGCFGEGCVVSYGMDLVGDGYNGGNTPVPGPKPFSTCDGHGTHVTGIIGARANPMGFIGAAPGATIGMYRVFGCSGDLGADVAIAAANQAFEDGSDIISLSLGKPSGWTEDPFSVVLSRIVDAGVICTVASGNSGSGGLFIAGSPANGKGVTAVASVESTLTPSLGTGAFVSTDKSTANQTVFVYTPGIFEFPNITLQVWAVTPDFTTDGTYGACNPLNANAPADLSDKVVLVKYDNCDSWTEVDNLRLNGAKYFMFWYSYVGNPFSLGATSAAGLGMTGYSQGMQWLKELSSGKDLYLTFVQSSNPTQAAAFVPNAINPNYIDTFTSWGPTWRADVNPSIATPGGAILSTWPLPKGGYYIDSGTSMATPLMASVYALLMEARGTKDPKTLLSLVSSTAKQLPFYDGKTLYANELAPVAQQGAGLAQAYNAAHVSTLLSVSNIAFNDTDNFVRKTSFAIKNTGKRSVTYAIGHTPSLTMYTYGNGDSHFPAPFPNPIAEGASANLAFSHNKITIPAGRSADVTIVANPPRGLNASALPVYSGYVTVNGTNGDDLVVPYLGIVGSLAKLPVIDPDFNYMVHYNIYSTAPAPDNTTFIMPYPESTSALPIFPSPDYPAALIQIDVGTPLLRVDLIPLGDTKAKVKTTKVLGVDIAGSLAGYPLSFSSRSFFSTPFTGMTQEGTVVPEGSYEFLVRALKIYGNATNPKDYESKSTQIFNIQYNTTASQS